MGESYLTFMYERGEPTTPQTLMTEGLSNLAFWNSTYPSMSYSYA